MAQPGLTIVSSVRVVSRRRVGLEKKGGKGRIIRETERREKGEGRDAPDQLSVNIGRYRRTHDDVIP